MANGAGGTWRLNLVFGLLMAAVVALGARLVLLIRDGRERAVELTERQTRRVIPLPARPGNVFARAGRSYVLLASSEQVPSCYVDPSMLRDEEIADTAIAVGDALGIDPIEVQEIVLSRREGRFAWIRREITAAQAAAIRRLRQPAVAIQHEWRRRYPNGDLAATVVGFRRADGAAGGGLELSHAADLSAADGRRVVLIDARRRPIWPLPELSGAPRDGRHVFLCIDAVIQRYLQEAVRESVEKFGAKWGTGVVVEPHTGRVLAMCSAPSYDPNRFQRAGPAHRTNRAISVPYEPGSVAKPLFAAAAVDAGLVDYQTTIFCEKGRYRAHRGGTITDHGKHYGMLTVTDVVVLSSNIGMAKIGEMLGNRNLYNVARRFGFGDRTGADLPGESRGIVREARRWDGYSLRRVPFGQEISTTALQLTMAFSALANGGLLLEPRIVESVRDSTGRVVWQGRRRVVRRVLSPSVAAQSLEVLREVVQRGTGRKCRMAKWTSFGKTGTAQIPGVGGYVEGAFTGTFVGGAPATGPRVLCLISIYWPDAAKGHYGATVAAPYVKRVLERTLEYWQVPPDRGLVAGLTGRGAGPPTQ